MSLRWVAIFALGGLGAVTPAYAQDSLRIELAHGSPAEAATKAQLQRLLETHQVSPWIFTRRLRIDETAIPHSHPTLTLHTRHLKDDDLLLSTFIHEQLHWYLVQQGQRTEAAIAELRARFPTIPVGYPEGAADERGSYVHLLVNHLEHRANRELLGELRASQVMNFWAADHYTWIYRTVLTQARDIDTIVIRHQLVPLTSRGRVGGLRR